MTRRIVDHGISILAAIVLLAVMISPLRHAVGFTGVGRVKAPRRGLVSKTIRCGLEARIAHAPDVGRPTPIGLKGVLEVRDEVESIEASWSAPSNTDGVISLRPRAIRQSARPASVGPARPMRC
jgi:hypothetical protein